MYFQQNKFSGFDQLDQCLNPKLPFKDSLHWTEINSPGQSVLVWVRLMGRRKRKMMREAEARREREREVREQGGNEWEGRWATDTRMQLRGQCRCYLCQGTWAHLFPSLWANITALSVHTGLGYNSVYLKVNWIYCWYVVGCHISIFLRCTRYFKSNNHNHNNTCLG